MFHIKLFSDNTRLSPKVWPHSGQRFLSENWWVPRFVTKSTKRLSLKLFVTDYRRQHFGRQPTVAKAISDNKIPLLVTTLSLAKSDLCCSVHRSHADPIIP